MNTLQTLGLTLVLAPVALALIFATLRECAAAGRDLKSVIKDAWTKDPALFVLKSCVLLGCVLFLLGSIRDIS